jgi:hypothetical protein
MLHILLPNMNSSNSESEPLPFPRVGFAPSELVVIADIIFAYMQFLQTAPHSSEIEARIATLHGVRQRLQKQLAYGMASQIQLPLNPTEIEELLKAMLG